MICLWSERIKKHRVCSSIQSVRMNYIGVCTERSNFKRTIQIQEWTIYIIYVEEFDNNVITEMINM